MGMKVVGFVVAAVMAAGVVIGGAGPAPGAEARASLGAGKPFQSGAASTNAAEELASINMEDPRLSEDGRWLVFTSFGMAPKTGDRQVYIKDTWSGRVEQVSVSSAEVPASAPSDNPAVSADGRYVVFEGGGVLAQPSGRIYRRDRVTGTTVAVDRANTSTSSDGLTRGATISDDGSRVAFESDNPNLAAPAVGYQGGSGSIYVRDLDEGRTELVSVNSSEQQVSGQSLAPRISGDGDHVLFSSVASDVVPGDANGDEDVFLRTLSTGTTERVGLGSTDAPPTGWAFGLDLSDEGRYVVFNGFGSGLLPGHTANGTTLVRDRTAGTTVAVSTTAAGVPVAGGQARIAGDGSAVAFTSTTSTLPGSPGDGKQHLYLRALPGGTTQRFDLGAAGQSGNGTVYDLSIADASTVAFSTDARNLTPANPNGRVVTHLRRRLEIAPSTSAASWIDRQYRDFAGRSPTASERSLWLSRITGGWHPSRLVTDLALAPAWAARRDEVTRLYWSFFLRRPDAGGLEFWIAKRRAGTSLNAIASSFAASAEFKTRYGALADPAFVTLVYRNVLGRDPDDAGKGYWVGQLGSGTTRGSMMVGFSESAEGKARMRPQVQTMLLALGMLRAAPTQADFDRCVGIVRYGGQLHEVVRILQATSTYQARS